MACVPAVVPPGRFGRRWRISFRGVRQSLAGEGGGLSGVAPSDFSMNSLKETPRLRVAATTAQHTTHANSPTALSTAHHQLLSSSSSSDPYAAPTLRAGAVVGGALVLLLAPAVFFAALPFLGVSLDDARAAGWQLPLVLGLVCVVAFGSTLDIAAIQAAQPAPLDSDRELCVIGYANILSAAFGGFTGSYIFSQVIFSQRQG
eukprot:gene1434-42789_t